MSVPSNYFLDHEALTLSEKIQQNTYLSGQLHNMNYRPPTSDKLTTSPDPKPGQQESHFLL